MDPFKPRITLTDEINKLVSEICDRLDAIPGLSSVLKHENRIRTIWASLAIEGNSLTFLEVKNIVNGKTQLTKYKEVKAVKNASRAYELTLDPFSKKDLLRAHKCMMNGLISEKGAFRRGGAGVFDGDVLVHVAPDAKDVADEMKSLMEWYQKSELHPLVKSCIFHYEFEYIHPFADGNGRTGRMWHSLILGSWNNLFYYLPTELFILARKDEYYKALRKSDRSGNCTAFVTKMLEIILDTVKDPVVTGEKNK